MKFLNVLQTLWCEPWLILPEMHKQLCEIVHAHITGEAHEAGGLALLFDDEQPAKLELTIVDNYAIIPIHGTIGKRVSNLAKSSGVTDVDDATFLINEATQDQRVAGILYDINSPGGTVTGVPELAGVVREASKKKPSVAWTDRLMASAAYWIGSAADAIYATESAMIGSVGVYMAWLDVHRAFEMEGYRTELIKHGKFKAMGLRGTTLDEEQRAHLQEEVDKVAAWFAASVNKKRNVPAEAMEGQTFYARDATANDIIDSIGDVDAAVEELQDLIEERGTA